MFHQDNVQAVRVDPPALYGAYEREYHESQLEHGKEKILYGELKTGRTVVAPCNTRDCTGRIFCEDGSGEVDDEGCYENSDKGGQRGCE
jgi:hypothetical protein